MSVTPLIPSLKEVVKGKMKIMYPSHIAYKVLVPAKESVEAWLRVPDDFVYIVPGEIHDVPVDVFTHRCEKDGFPILPETLIDGTSMALNYPFPMLVEDHWHGIVKNVSDKDEIFRLRVPFVVVSLTLIKELREQAKVEDELIELFVQEWRKKSLEQKIELIMKAPELITLLAG